MRCQSTFSPIGPVFRARWVLSVLPVLAAVVATGLPAAEPADPAAAEREYRIARRLAAEGAPEAATSLRRVLELDPRGALADDALLDLALLSGVAGWPEEIGSLQMVAAPRARVLLDRVLTEFPDGDRSLEARYRLGLLGLEPVPGRKVADARSHLIEAATSADDREWSARARYALAWLLERDGSYERAAEAYWRILVDTPGSAAATRGRLALGRNEIYAGRLGQAALHLQEAIDAGMVPDAVARALREFAADRVIDPQRVTDPRRSAFVLEPSELSGFAPTVGGGVVLADRRQGRVRAFGSDGRVEDEWSLEDAGALAVDEEGRLFVAAGEAIYRLDPGGEKFVVSAVGDYAPPQAIAASKGGFWVADRRGQRIGWVEPGAPLPGDVWLGKGSKLVALVWDGRRLVALDSKSSSLVTIDSSGVPRSIGSTGLVRPDALSVDPSGALVVLDSRAGQLVLLDQRGVESARFETVALGVEHPTRVGVGLDGALHLYDPASGVWVRVR